MSLGCSCGWIQPHSFWVQLPTTWPVCSAYCSPCIRKVLWEAATAKKISRALSSVSSGILTTLMSVKKVCLPGPGPQSYDSFHFIMYLLLFYASKCSMSFKKKQQLQQLQSGTIYWAGYMALLVINKRTWRCFKFISHKSLCSLAKIMTFLACIASYSLYLSCQCHGHDKQKLSHCVLTKCLMSLCTTVVIQG